MYKKHFGFKERPFTLVPNPAFLFLSKSHEEALAHLSYAVEQGEGFVEITGEVGTGKTTLCRAFIEGLDNNTEVAYIFNPKLDSIQLLKAINDELNIDSKPDNTKDLIDTLNRFLIKKISEGGKSLILIDEAQNLSPDVLEQLRLLSNLETNTKKLLQIILVGQPELGEMLNSYELRQLGQRITLSCHISPLTARETSDYIQHRIQRASLKSTVKFDRTAIRNIYKFSGGVPRLINIACDRALLTAFVLNQQKVTGKTSYSAIRELSSTGGAGKKSPLYNKIRILTASIIIVFLLIFILSYNEVSDNNTILQKIVSSAPESSETNYQEQMEETSVNREFKEVSQNKKTRGETQPVVTSNDKKLEKVIENSPTMEISETTGKRQVADIAEELTPHEILVNPEPLMAKEETSLNLEFFLKKNNGRSTRSHAIINVLELWGIKPEIEHDINTIRKDHRFFQLAAEKNGLNLYSVNNNLALIKILNLPAVLKFKSMGDQPPGFYILYKTTNNKITLSSPGNGEKIEVEDNEFKLYWENIAYIPWMDKYSITGIIPVRAPWKSVVGLKNLLEDIGFSYIEINSVYDENCINAVKEIQKKYGITVDGIVGTRTKIALYNESRSFKGPHINN
ncbi:MAG: AAA family ATPase [Desulfobacterales bacterium]|nr:AAA family ATPase [Desulfobacteraceae bacterium]MBT4364699.1 AAA family ATPase [Desulfobacteraceae bacterium]MBT7697421.1 AAA family ATPase [Desulfobacterales bacterium]